MLKIDTEDYEYRVLIGALNTIKMHKPIIFFECLNDNTGNQIYNTLDPFGYKFYEIDDLNEVLTPVQNIKAVRHPNGQINMHKLNRIAFCGTINIH
jgi:hypothetical protein